MLTNNVILGIARTSYPKLHWSVVNPLDEPTITEITATITFYARAKIDNELLDRNYAKQIVAHELEGVVVTLEGIMQDWIDNDISKSE